MCGIVGLLNSDESDALEGDVVRMANALTHRGPDDQGTWSAANQKVVLGFRRLAILDLSETGAQPMTSSDGRWTIVHNGEVYNFRALRDALEEAGRRFRGTSDTEVVLEAVAEWGFPDALDRLEGMFAFALWDDEKGRLHLARDRIGQKPLYYGRIQDSFVFASELEALRSHPRFETKIDPRSVSTYLRRGYVPTPRSIYRNVSKLPPSTFLTVGSEGEIDGPHAYWSAKDVAERGQRNVLQASEEELADRLEEKLRGSVRRCMESDVPLGVWLSGGVDSSTIAALAQTEADTAIRSFTIGFEDDVYDESDKARIVADHLGTDHRELYAQPADALGLVPELPKIYDEPFADSSQIPTHLLARMARDHVTVALSGDGGDEVFGGYTRHFAEHRIFRWTDKIPVPIRKWTAKALRAPPSVVWNRLEELVGPVAEGYGAGGRLGRRIRKGADLLEEEGPAERYEAATTVWEEGNADVSPEAGGEVSRGEEIRLENPVHRVMYRDLVTYLPDDIFTKVDRATMAVGLESRAPLVDREVVEFAWRLPLEATVDGGQGKRLLRRILRRHLPAELAQKPKSGFAVPIARWLRDELHDWADDLLDPTLLDRQGFIDSEPVEQAWEEHRSRRADRHEELWTVLMFQAWLKEHHPDRW